MATTKQHSMIGQLCLRLRLDKEAKANMIYSFTEGREESTTGLTVTEARDLIGRLMRDAAFTPSPEQDEKWRMKRKILSLAHEMRWEMPGNRVDMRRLNNWLERYGVEKKPLDKISYSGLVKTVTQMQQYYESFLKGI